MGDIIQFGRSRIANPQRLLPLSELRCDEGSEVLVDRAERTTDIGMALIKAIIGADCANEAFYERRNLNAFSLHLRVAKAAIKRAEEIYASMVV